MAGLPDPPGLSSSPHPESHMAAQSEAVPMKSLIVPTAPLVPTITMPDSPFHQLQSPSHSELVENRSIPATERRLLIPNFIELFCWETIQPLLPFRLPGPGDPPAYQSRTCRSCYHWQAPDQIHSSADLASMTPYFGTRFKSHFGPPGFDPLSRGLAMLLAIYRKWDWASLANELRQETRGQDYRQSLGFQENDLPCASTFRMACQNTPDFPKKLAQPIFT